MDVLVDGGIFLISNPFRHQSWHLALVTQNLSQSLLLIVKESSLGYLVVDCGQMRHGYRNTIQ